MTTSTNFRTGFDGDVRVLTAHDREYFRDLITKLRTRSYAVTGREASDAISTLLDQVERLSAKADRAAVEARV